MIMHSGRGVRGRRVEGGVGRAEVFSGSKLPVAETLQRFAGEPLGEFGERSVSISQYALLIPFPSPPLSVSLHL